MGVLSEEGIVRLFQNKGSGQSENDTNKLLPKDKSPRSRNSIKGTAGAFQLDERDKELNSRLAEIRKLEAQIYILKREAKTLSKNRVKLLLAILAWFTVSLIYWGITSRTGYPQFIEYFVIGNGVMVAIIIWQLVRPPDLASRKQVDRSRGRRR